MRTDVEVLDVASCAFRAMGTDVHVVVLDGDDADLHWAHAEIDRLEDLWSRFRDGSEVTRVNRQAGSWVDVAPETAELLRAAIEAWQVTDGAFDPLLGSHMATLGYDRTFEQIDQRGAGATCPQAAPAPRQPDDLEVDRALGRARIAPGRSLDLGGLAKGWTADRIVAGLLDRGAAGACANLGGDVAVGGRAPRDEGWYVAVDHQAARAPHGLLAVRTGGVATSTTRRRHWQGPGGDERHHLVDPRRGTPCQGPIVEVTTIGGAAARAEILTKVAFVAPDRLGLTMMEGEAALLTTADGLTRSIGERSLLRPVAGGDAGGC